MKYHRIDIATINKITFKLIVPTTKNKDKYPKYYIEYTYNGRQYQVTKDIKKMYLELDKVNKALKWDKIEWKERLVELFMLIVDDILSTLDIQTEEGKSKIKINLYSRVLDAINAFFDYQKGQHKLGELAGISNYLDRNKKLNSFFKSNYHDILIKELTANVWDDFRIFLKKQDKVNSTVNQYITYVKSWYNWIIDYHEVPTINHTNKLKKLDISQQEKKYKDLENDVIAGFLDAVASDEKWLRLELITRLIAENTIRPIQVRNIQSKHINRENKTIEVYDRKGKRWRTIIFTDKVLEIINKIFGNTIQRGFAVEDDDYLIGGHNSFKKGIPYSQNMVKDLLIEPFREAFPKFKNVNIYDFKHTSITKASKHGNLVEVQKRAGHGKITTTQIYDRSKAISEAISIEDLLLIK